MFCVSLMATTKKIPTEHTQNQMRKKIKACQYKNQQTKRKAVGDMRDKTAIRQKTVNKMATVSPSPSVITVNVTGLNSPNKTQIS